MCQPGAVAASPAAISFADDQHLPLCSQGIRHDTLEQFAAIVGEFCDWCDGEPQSAEVEAREAIVRLSRVYGCALGLGIVQPPRQVPLSRITDEKWKAMYRRLVPSHSITTGRSPTPCVIAPGGPSDWRPCR